MPDDLRASEVSAPFTTGSELSCAYGEAVAGLESPHVGPIFAGHTYASIGIYQYLARSVDHVTSWRASNTPSLVSARWTGLRRGRTRSRVSANLTVGPVISI